MSAFFDGFSLETVATTAGSIRLRRGGNGPALMLLHGHPRTHATWDRVATCLARDFTVICPDLPGFGASYQPDDAPGHAGSSKRAKAAALVAVMEALGHPRFLLGGHDRGAYTAFRLAMDHPGALMALAIMDAVPIVEALERANWRFARDWWHWFFFCTPEKPERAILADPEAWYSPPGPGVSPEARAEWLAAVHDPAVVHGMIEDYRAGLAIDHLHDRSDREAGRRLACPLTVLWSLRDDLARIYGDPLAIWRPWAGASLRGQGIDSGHHMAEDAPDALAAALREAFTAGTMT